MVQDAGDCGETNEELAGDPRRRLTSGDSEEVDRCDE
jgi:hypothetical protein